MSDRKPTYLLYLAANVCGRAAMLIVLVALTRFLDKAEYGLFALVVASGEILDMVASNWIRIRFLREEAGKAHIGAVRLGRTFILLGVSTVLACVMAAGISVLVGAPSAVVFAVSTMAYVVAFAVLRLCLSVLQHQERHLWFAVVEISRSALVCALAVAAAVMWPSYVAPVIALSGVTLACALAGLFAALRGNPRPRMARTGYAQALKFGAPVAAVALLTYALGWYDRFILNSFAGPAAVGIYAAGFALARQPAAMLLSAMNTYTFPRLARLKEQGGDRAVADAQRGLLVSMSTVAGVVTAGLIALNEPAAAFLYPQDYHADVAAIMPPIALGTLLVNLKLFVFDNNFYMTRHTGLLIGYMLPTAIVATVASVVLIAQLGLQGAAWGYLAGAALALAASVVTSRRVLAFDPAIGRLCGILAAALAAGAAGHFVSAAVSAQGVLVQLIGGGVSMLLVYAIILHVIGLPFAAILRTPWDLGDGGLRAAGGGMQ
ncbi:MAG: lipopolysaccharide biosynthesis protein [Rhodobiaceae bacterium]|nr:lipopolysaccharide biosynthesis protein [Rhodobiaceae bacterium]